MRLKTKFQDEDFDLGEVVDGAIVECLGRHEEKLRVIATAAKGGQSTFYYNSIKQFMDDWEDAPEEPKEYWAIDQFGEPINVTGLSRLQLEKLHRTGNDFPSEDATMKAIEKFKAWKRLKDKGFKFGGWKRDERFWGDYTIEAQDYTTCDDKDLDICFGGEE